MRNDSQYYYSTTLQKIVITALLSGQKNGKKAFHQLCDGVVKLGFSITKKPSS
jgi:hypothetical protein